MGLEQIESPTRSFREAARTRKLQEHRDAVPRKSEASCFVGLGLRVDICAGESFCRMKDFHYTCRFCVSFGWCCCCGCYVVVVVVVVVSVGCCCCSPLCRETCGSSNSILGSRLLSISLIYMFLPTCICLVLKRKAATM